MAELKTSHTSLWPKTQMKVLILAFLHVLNWCAVPCSKRSHGKVSCAAQSLVLDKGFCELGFLAEG